eukprot:6499031-Pyramimonas_sp.AAC.1
MLRAARGDARRANAPRAQSIRDKNEIALAQSGELDTSAHIQHIHPRPLGSSKVRRPRGLGTHRGNSTNFRAA